MRKAEALSLLGKPLYAEDMTAGADVAALEEKVAAAKAAAQADPHNPEPYIAYADAVAACGRFQEAIGLYTAGLQKWPDEPMLYCRRGHRYLNVRQFERALADLQHAASLKDDVFDIWYHLGLAHWMLGDFAAARDAFVRCREVAPHESQQAAVTDWLFMTLRRLGQKEEAAALLAGIHRDMEMTGNNHNYLNRLLFYKGELTEEELLATCRPGTLDAGTVKFGLGCWHLSEGREDTALRYFEEAAETRQWAAFGVSGAENELCRMRGIEPEQPETFSLLGQPLYATLAVSPEARPSLEAALAEAKAAAEAERDDVERIRAYAKSLAALSRYRDAVAVLTEALGRMPNDPMLLCDRGHYYVNVRKFDLALADLNAAAEIRDDVFDIWYHMALAYWMSGQFAKALATFQKCYDVTTDESHKVAITDWLYMTLRRLGRHDEAAPLLDDIHPNMVTTGNNHFYLKRLMFYKGEMSEQEMIEICQQGGLAHANGYALGCWHLYNGRPEQAQPYFEQVVREGTAWPAFALISAEAELLRALIGEPETVSLLGKPLYAATAQAGLDVAKLESQVASAKAVADAHPDDVWRYIFYVKRVEALHRYREAIALYTAGLERWPDEPMLYCHRGHRYLNLREFDRALADLLKAKEMKPDSFDVLYHLGLVYYMQGNYEQALAELTRCNEVTTDEGDVPPSSALKLIAPARVLQVGTIDWIYMTLSRLGRFDEAEAVLEQISPDLDTGGNMIYYMNRVRFYQGRKTEEELLAEFGKSAIGTQTLGYGLGNWHFCRGNYDKARQYYEQVVAGRQWAPFGRIAAEVDLARNL